MNRHRFICIPAIALLLAAQASWGAITANRVSYRGWPGAYRLSNGTVDLVFVPQIGRVMRYGYVGGPNMLFENAALGGKTTDLANPGNDWTNFGGDKLWPAPQSRWNWPPDPVLDSGPQTVRISSEKHLLVRGPVSVKYGVRYLRDIALDPTGTGVTLKNTLVNTSNQDLQWAAWEVCQINDPDDMRLPLNKAGHFAQGYYVFKDSDPQPGMLSIVGDEAQFKRNSDKPSKIGGDSPLGWIAADKDGTRITISETYEPGKEYPDDGCAEEIYTNPDALKYIELELLSPLQNLKPGDKYDFTTHWSLSKTPPSS